jgi:hypothetical protein
VKVTEHNVDADWKVEELDALMELVKREIKDGGDKSIQMFYAKIYGKLIGIKHEIQDNYGKETV